MTLLDLSDANPLPCNIIRRLNRFTVEVVLNSQTVKASINNTGRLYDFLTDSRSGFCLKNPSGLKTGYRLIAVSHMDGAALIDTQLQMRAFEKAVELKYIPWLLGFKIARRNVRLNDSVIDYLIDCGDASLFLEAKSAVLYDGSFAMYPDCPTLRGQRHVKELIKHQLGGSNCAILFIAALPGVTAFKPNAQADPQLYNLLKTADLCNVLLKSIGIYYRPDDATIRLYSPDLPVIL